jgi:hypothetical protein
VDAGYVPQAKAIIPPSHHRTTDVLRTFVVHIKLSNQGHGSRWIQGRHGSPAGCTRHFRCRESDRPAIEEPLGTLVPPNADFAPRVSLLGICWPERSNGSTRRLDSKAAQAPMPARLPKCTKSKYSRFCQECPGFPRIFYRPPSPCVRRQKAWALCDSCIV